MGWGEGRRGFGRLLKIRAIPRITGKTFVRIIAWRSIVQQPSVFAVVPFKTVCYFDFLSSITGMDYGIETNRFGVVYHLASIPYQTQLTLKISKENSRDINDLPAFPSITSVYRTADWHEREAYDLVGIFFEGHPDLRRILLPDDWEGYPLRKDYKTAEYYKGIKID